MRVYVIDNYDSFTFNLVHSIEKYCEVLKVVRNDEVNVNEIEEYDKILLSPGPGLPSEVPILNVVLNLYAGVKPILGVCLGMQAIAEFFGGSLYNIENVVHGVPANTLLCGAGSYIFDDVLNEFQSGRYHSWAVSRKFLPNVLEETAIDDNGVLMALKHKFYDINAVQFHPESIMTLLGDKIIENWCRH